MHGMKRAARMKGHCFEGRGRMRHGGRGEPGEMFGGGFAGRGGGHRRGKRFAGEELRLMTLALLEQEPRHGYQLIRAFGERSGEAYMPSPGVLYPLLTMLQDMELIAEADGGGRARSFTLTEAGKAELDANRPTADALLQKLASMAEKEGRAGSGPVRRAMINLRTALMQRLSRDGADEDLAFRIAAVIDEAAQKVERL